MVCRFVSMFAQFFSLVILVVATQSANAQGPFQPLPEHEILKKDVGTWDAKMTMYIPGTPEPMVFNATEKNEMLGDLWVISSFDCKSDAFSFTGHGQFGYDPQEKKYVGTWTDSMSPSLSVMKGDYDAKTKTMTMYSKGFDHQMQKEVESKNVSKRIDDDHRQFEMYMKGEDGTYTKIFEIAYTRKK